MADTFKGIITADGKKRQLPYNAVFGTPASDPTLSLEGAFADSKAVGDKFKETKAETDSLKEDLVDLDCAVFNVKTGSDLTWIIGGIAKTDGRPSYNNRHKNKNFKIYGKWR